MPMDGNPHPLPGNLHADGNMFVVPPFPELGWNGQQFQPQDNINNNEIPEENQEAQPDGMQDSDSVVIDHQVADNDMEVVGPIGNIVANQVLVPHMQLPLEHQLAFTRAVGPELPPTCCGTNLLRQSFQWSLLPRYQLVYPPLQHYTCLFLKETGQWPLGSKEISKYSVMWKSQAPQLP